MALLRRRRNSTPDDLPEWVVPVSILATVAVVIWVGLGIVFGGEIGVPEATGPGGASPVVVGGTPSDTQPDGSPGTTAGTVEEDPEEARQVASAAAVARFTDEWSNVPVASPSDLPPPAATRWPAAVVRSLTLVGEAEGGGLTYQASVDPDGGDSEPARVVTVHVRNQDGGWVFYTP